MRCQTIPIFEWKTPFRVDIESTQTKHELNLKSPQIAFGIEKRDLSDEEHVKKPG